MAVAEQPTQQVAELLQNMEIGTETKSTDACEMPTRDQNNCGTSSSVLSSSEDANTMDNEGEQDVLVEQGLYYPANNYYGYYCTGYEVPGREWDEHGHFVGLDGSEIQYPGVHPESVPLVYYTPGYSYTPPPYNPYNPYIPGAVIGVDGQILGQQPYYTGPIYQHAVSSPGFYPPSVQSGSEVLPTSSPEYGPVVDAANVNGLNINTTATIPSTAHPAAVIHPHGTLSRGMLSMGIPVSSAQDCKNSDQTCEGQQRSAVSVRQPTLQGAMPSTSLSPQCSKPINQSQQQGSAIQGRVQAKGYLPFVKVPPPLHQGRVTLPLINNIADFKSSERGYAGADRLKQRDQLNGNQSNGNGNLDVLSEQNRGPRTNRTRNQWISPTALRNSGSQGVVGTVGSQGVVINTESYGPTINKGQYNRADFPLNYDDARFFVIKSYSEDDIHKSIKYNVWSSTPNGNKRLDGAYQDAQERSGGNPGSCPVFLFFSVNASGQFCGVAEMTGPVNFKTNKDFWQQDKWNGYFPVKWHIIKDVSNSHLRHIILENNENKPVTNSRDTQEIKYSQGMEMLNIFKNYSWKTSILDDFLYYEDRQKAMQEKKSRQQVKQQQQLQPSVQAAHIQPKQSEEEPCKFDGKISRASDFNSPDGKSLSSVQAAHIQPKQSEEEPCKFDGKVGRASDFNSPDGKSLSSCVNGRQLPESIPVKHNLLGSPSIGQKEESVPLKVADRKKDESKGINCDGNGILTVGTVPIDTRVNYDNPSVLTVGTLAIDTRGVNCDIPSVVTVGTMAIDTNRTDSGIPCVITVGTVPIDPNGVKSDGRSVFTVGTVRIS